MSSVVTRFTLGSKTDVQLGIQLLEGYDEPAAPSTIDYTKKVPGRAGAWDFGADLDKRVFNLRCQFVDATTQAELAAAIRTLTNHLLDDDGEPRDLSLVFAKESSKTYTVRYTGQLPIKRVIASTSGEFTLQLTAYDPYAYGSQVTTTATITTSPGTLTVTNSGSQNTPCVITVTNNGAATISGFTLTRTST